MADANDKRIDELDTVTPTANHLLLLEDSTTHVYGKATTTAVSAAAAPVQSVAGRTGAVTLTSTDVGLSNVNNTSDTNKPVSTAQATADALVASTAATNLATHTGNTSNPHSVTKTQVGLGNADNTSDASKPVSTATQTALDLKANLASPTFTGTPAVPTAVAGTNTTQIASTAFVKTAVDNVIAAAPGALDTLDELAAALGDDANYAATVTTALAGKQPLDADLTTIAGLTATTDNFMQSKAGAWASRTIAQVKTDLGLTGTNSGDQSSIVGITGTLAQFNTAVTDADLARTDAANTFTGIQTMVSPAITTPIGIVKSDVGLGNVDNTSDATERAATRTLTNARITPRTGTTTSSATPTINTDNVDFYSLTAQTVDITSFTTNLSGTPTEAQKLWIAITGTAARAITWGASFESGAATLPTTTVTTTRLDAGFIWNTVTSKWRCVASGSG